LSVGWGAESVRRRLLVAGGLFVAAGVPSRVQSQGPASGKARAAAAQTVTFIVPFSAGSGPDAFVRALAHEVGATNGVTTIVDNRPGAGSVLAAQAVARAAPDGNTVLVTGNVAFTGNPHVMKRLPYDPVADFSPVAGMSRGPMILYVNPGKLPVRAVAEFLRLLQREPERYSYAYTSITSRLPAEVLQQAAGVKLVGVPYRSGAAALPDLISGQVDMLFTDFSAWPHVDSGHLRAIAVTDVRRSPYAPELPTFAEAGVAQMDIGFWLAAYLPARAAPEVVGRLEAKLTQALQVREVQAALRRFGATAFPLPARALAEHQAREFEAWGRIIQAAGIKRE
jgi:tripartite-type tricarboxylate transporter receptor subunit TctC